MTKRTLSIMAGMVFLACSDQGPVVPEDFAIYRVTPGYEVQLGMDSSVDIDQLVLEPSPVITLDDIAWYNWTLHILALTDRGRGQVSEEENRQPFVVTVDGARVYAGVFWSDILSSVVTGITFDLEYVRIGQNQVWISFVDRGGDPEDLRSDSRIRRVLEDAGKLR